MVADGINEINEKEQKRTLSLRKKMKYMLDVGQLLMENGAPSRRIVQEMLMTASYLGIYRKNVQIHITYTTIMVNAEDGDESHTSFRKCLHHHVNMRVILETGKCIWQALREHIPLSAYGEAIENIQENSRRKSYPEWLLFLGAGIACAAFCLLFGGDLPAAAYTLFAAFVGMAVRRIFDRGEVNGYVGIAASAGSATLAAYPSLIWGGTATPWLPMTACTLALIPGVPLITAVDDFLNNYLTSGMTRAAHTMLILLAMTFGIACVVSFLEIPAFTETNVFPERLYVAQAPAAAIGALGFALVFNVPKLYLPLACLGAAVATETRNILFIECGWGMAEASFCGAALWSLLCFASSRFLRAPFFIVTLPAMIPLMPGVLMYRLLLAVLDISSLTSREMFLALQNGVEAVLILLGIAVGATIPHMAVRRLLHKEETRKLDKSLHREKEVHREEQ